MFALRSSLPFFNMASRLAVDLDRSESGRWQILLHWIDGWLKTSVFWGQGWGVIPENVAWAPWSKDPHNVYVQILADGGLWGVGCIVLALIVLLRSTRQQSLTLPSLAFAAGLFIYQGVDRIWAISSGLYIVLLSLASFFSIDCFFCKPVRPVSRSACITILLGATLPVINFLLVILGAGRP